MNAARSPVDTASSSSVGPPVLNRWLAPLTTLARSVMLSAGTQGDRNGDTSITRKVVEANVRAQVVNVCGSEPVMRAWATARANGVESGREVWVHGWVYEVESGKLQDLGVSKGCVDN